MGSTWILPEMAHHLDFSPEKETKGVRASARREDGSPIRFLTMVSLEILGAPAGEGGYSYNLQSFVRQDLRVLALSQAPSVRLDRGFPNNLVRR